MNTDIYIPKRINVGYQKRSDTYTGKLAYVIYYDNKGKLRKETSWNNWRNQSIPNEEFDNEPTSGFVLNKKVGDCGDHFMRQAYCRIYDPRGFEFEIGIDNLIWILENADCIKGKGLSGEFVYGWHGKDLLLIPCESPDYKNIVNYTNSSDEYSSIKMNELVVGAEYKTIHKNAIFLGRFPKYDIKKGSNGSSHRWTFDRTKLESYNPKKKYYWFAYKSGWNNTFYLDICTTKKIYGKIADRSVWYNDAISKLESSAEYCPIDDNRNTIVQLSYEQFLKILQNSGEMVRVVKVIGDNLFDYQFLFKNENGSYYYYDDNSTRTRTTPLDFYNSVHPVKIVQYLINGQEYKRYFDYG